MTALPRRKAPRKGPKIKRIPTYPKPPKKEEELPPVPPPKVPYAASAPEQPPAQPPLPPIQQPPAPVAPRPGVSFAANLGAAMVAIAITLAVLYFTGFFSVVGELFAEPQVTSYKAPGTTTGGTGYCQRNSDCSRFGSKNCGGSSLVRCGSDNLCHCCYAVCPGGVCSGCVPCSKGCDVNQYCEGGACVFYQGGRTTD